MPVDKNNFFKKIGYKPHSSAQWAYHNSPARFRVACCGRRFGKSTMAARDLEPELFKPKKRFWAVGPTYDLGEKEFRVVWDDLIIGQKLGRDKRIKKAYNKRSGDMYIEFPWQTRFEVRSADHPEGLVGEALDRVIMSEAAKHKRETWERFIRPSLSDRRGGADFPTTPEGHNWLYELWMFGQDKTILEYESWRFPSWENVVIYPEGRNDPEILLLEKTTAHEWFEQEIGADFASFVGKIYGEFDETIHIKNHTYNPEWDSWGCWDWGFVNALVFLEFQVDPFDNIYIWREHYQSYWNLNEHINYLKSRRNPPGWRIDCSFGDSADPAAASQVSADWIPCVVDPMAKENWRQGIDLVKRFLKTYQIGIQDEYGTPLTAPKLFIDPSCKNLLREFPSYRAPDKISSALRESGTASATNKQDDHALDALRYGMMHVFELGAKYHLSSVAGIGIASSPGQGNYGSDPATAPSGGYEYDDERLVFTASDSGFFTSGKDF